MSTTLTDRPSTPRPATNHRWWFPIGVVVLGAGGIAFLQLQPELERNLQAWGTSAVVLLAAVLILLRFLGWSRFSGRVRLLTLVVLVLTGFGLKNLLRVDGTVDGTGRPKLVWRWKPSHHVLPAPAARSVEPTTALELPTAQRGKGADVPQFFGPKRDGVVEGAKLVRDWSTSPPKELWRQPVGAGWSAFAVVGGRVYTQEQRGEEEAVTCYDLASGRLLWVHANPVHFQQWQGGDGPRATPTVHQGRVFAIGATGLLDCLDASTGQLLWSRDVLTENQLANLTWGVSGSPLVFEDTVVVTGGLTNGPTVLAYRRSNGEPLWSSGSDKASYSSPILAELAGRRVVLSFNAASLTAHDPSTGEMVLRYPWSDDKWPKAAQPVVIGSNRVFISAGYGAGCELVEVTAASDGKLSATQVWKNIRLKTQFNSVAARDGFLYGLDDGLLACVEIATGERRWKQGRYGSGQTLLVDDLVLIQSEAGAVFLAAATPANPQEFGRIPALSAKTWNHPTLAGRYLLVRNSEEMVCYELPVQKASRAP